METCTINFDNSKVEVKNVNINSNNGNKESLIKQYRVLNKLYYDSSNKTIIIGISSRNLSVSEGDFGSYSNTIDEEGFFYLAKNEKDWNSALELFKSNKMPEGTIIGTILTNHDHKTYDCNNDFPFSVCVSTNLKVIGWCLEKPGFVPIAIYHHDDFVFHDELHAYMNEYDINTIMHVKNFYSILDPKKRIKVLWDVMKIEEWNIADGNGELILDQYNLSNDKTFRQTILDAYDNLAFGENKSSISRMIEENKRVVKNSEKKKHNKNNNNKCFSKINFNFENLLPNIKYIYNKNIKYSDDLTYVKTYDQMMNKVLNLLTSPRDSVDTDCAMQCIGYVFNQIGNPLKDKKELSFDEMLSILSNTLNVSIDKIKEINKQPLKTCINLFNYLRTC